MKRSIVFLFFCFVSLNFIVSTEKSLSIRYSFNDSATTIQPMVKESALSKDWYRKAVFYELFVREFYDSNGDGVGDFQGVIAKLDYLKSLGIGGIWLLPINANYDDDHGYAVMDYMGLESDYGTLEDLQELIDEAHKRGIGIILDLVFNHSSANHPFFQEALSSRDSEYRDWYIWRDDNLYWRQPWSTKEVWHKTIYDDYYFGLFDDSMPDFNYHNEAVYRYMKDVVVYWLNLGIDGFRIDAAKHIFENEQGEMSDLPETIAFFQGLRRVINQFPDKFVIGEVESPEYLGDGDDGLNAYFNFGFVGALSKSLYFHDSSYLVTQILTSEKTLPEGASYANVLGNHDFFLGPRVMSRFHGKIPLAKVAASLLLTVPGIPFLYYGEEIGMKNSKTYSYDWSLRTPMQWNGESNGGFSSIKKLIPRKTNRDYKKVNVELQERDENSLLSHYRTLIALRNRYPALQVGTIKFLPLTPSLLGFTRERDGETVTVVINLTDRKITLDTSLLEGQTILLGSKELWKQKEKLTLDGYATLILLKNR